MSYFDQAGVWGKSFEKMASCEIIRLCAAVRARGERWGVCCRSNLFLSHHSYLDYRWDSSSWRRKSFLASYQKVWGPLCLPQQQTALASALAAQPGFVNQCRLVKTRRTLQQLHGFFRKGGDDSTSLQIGLVEEEALVRQDQTHACWHSRVFAANSAALNVHVFLCVSSCIGFESRVGGGGGRTILLFPVCASRDSLVLRWKTRHCPLFPPWDVSPSLLSSPLPAPPLPCFSHSHIWGVTLTCM